MILGQLSDVAEYRYDLPTATQLRSLVSPLQQGVMPYQY
jgi:hypothetical protein